MTRKKTRSRGPGISPNRRDRCRMIFAAYSLTRFFFSFIGKNINVCINQGLHHSRLIAKQAQSSDFLSRALPRRGGPAVTPPPPPPPPSQLRREVVSPAAASALASRGDCVVTVLSCARRPPPRNTGQRCEGPGRPPRGPCSFLGGILGPARAAVAWSPGRAPSAAQMPPLGPCLLAGARSSQRGPRGPRASSNQQPGQGQSQPQDWP